MDPPSPRGTPGRLPAIMLVLVLLLRAAAGLAPAPSTTSRTYLASLGTPATAEAAAAAAPARRPGRAAEALREKRAAEEPYLDGLDRRQWLTTAFARERGEAGRYLATLNDRGAANKLSELRSREAATTDYYLEGLDRSKWTATAFSRELERRRREKLTVARKPAFVTLVEDAPPVLAPAVEIYASDLPATVDVATLEAAASAIELVAITDQVADAVGEVLEEAALSLPEEEEDSLAWKGAMLFVTVAWATNFAITAYACENISHNTGLGAAQAAAVFVVLRFAAAAASTAPWLLAASSKEAAIVGAKVGGLYALGYGAQAAALAHGFPAANAAFVCSLQCVAVALLGKGTPPMRTMVGLVLAISGVACLELLGANGGGSPDALGLALALGQPLAFGASYVVLEKATRDHPNDALAMTALQCVAIFCSGIAALSAMEGGFDVALSDVLTTWNHLDGQLAASVAWTGIVSTSFTIWLCTQSFKHLSSVDASLILTSEPLWAAVVAAALLGEHFSAGDALGGLLILLAVAINDGLIKAPKGLTMAPNQMLERRSVFSTFKNTAMAGASLVVADKAWASIAEPTQSAVASAIPNKVARQILQIERLNVDSNGSGDRKTHKPRLEISGNSAKVCIDGYSPGEGDRVQYIWLKNEEADAIVAAKEFPEDFKGTPVLTCNVTPGRTHSPCAYFTVHGLWLGRSETA